MTMITINYGPALRIIKGALAELSEIPPYRAAPLFDVSGIPHIPHNNNERSILAKDAFDSAQRTLPNAQQIMVSLYLREPENWEWSLNNLRLWIEGQIASSLWGP